MECGATMSTQGSVQRQRSRPGSHQLGDPKEMQHTRNRVPVPELVPDPTGFSKVGMDDSVT